MTFRVGILPHADLPHIVPCFRIGRELIKSGYDVYVLGSDVLKIGRGHSEAWKDQLAAFGLNGREIVHRDPADTIADWIGKQSIELRLDVVILDAVWQGLAYACQDASVKNVVVHHAGLPDFRSSDMPTWYFVHPGQPREFWSDARRLNEACERSGRGRRGLFSSVKALSAAGRKANDAYGFGCGELESVPAVRAMSLCPAAEFPDERGRVAYFGTLLHKPEDIDWMPLPLELSDATTDMIACVFGTTALHTRDDYAWLIVLAKTLADRFTNYRVVVVVPEQMRRELVPGDYPKNLLPFSWIPLWPLLSTCRGRKVLVTAPGLGAFREAMASGTPIVAIPCQEDQFGAAARVEYFGTGSALVADPLPQPDIVVERVARVLEDAGVWTRSQRLRDAFAEFDATQPLRTFMDGLR